MLPEAEDGLHATEGMIIKQEFLGLKLGFG